ncbi:MAG: pantetheine-phosphate adenylyltransferase [Planctomycetota bacterium]|nr:pantetheine-phosphate adenylyltransferase [Planctomycetota bacterium]
MASSPHAVFPGTFDPITLGHLDVVRRATALFPRVTVAVAQHHAKNHLFSAEERMELVREAVAPLETVEVAALDGLLVEGVKRLGGSVVVRGVRSAADLDYERQMALTNRALSPAIETVFVIPAPELTHVSSTLVRQIAALGGDVTPFVPHCVARRLAERFPKP